jgi:hypothetical protein
MAHTNTKAFRVVLTDGTERVIQANEVVAEDGRLKFLGAVQGHSTYNREDLVAASLLAETVAEYGVVPVSDEVYTGHNTYRITYTTADGVGDSGVTNDVVADRVMFTQGPEKGAGQFCLVTNLRGYETRSEFVIGESRVYSILRVTEPDAKSKGKAKSNRADA